MLERRLKRAPLFAGLLCGLLGSTASAAPSPGNKIEGRGGNFGAGVSIGAPLGGSVKYFLHPSHALQGDIGWALLHHGHGRFGIDYLWHPATLASGPVLDLIPYLGLGVGMGFWAGGRGHGRRHGHRGRGGVAFMLRAPVLGFGIHWKKAPLDTMLEGSWAPYLVLPDLGHGDVSLKIRYYF